ncbi:hypothetical protein [Gemmatimonas sp.]|uniref:hypothetical protein n=1 Tax=Gemmatimonas sp. TaxID=1962908 RepID=UPI0022C2EEB1|nr:hypothetical protein [Gemmatimonas sp.]MCZ8206526.1 hypothetical protein [Gemmatimonas sp.]
MNEPNLQALPTIRPLGGGRVAIDLHESDLTKLRCELLLAAADGSPSSEVWRSLAWSLSPSEDRRVSLSRAAYTELVRVLCRSTVTRRIAHTHARRLELARVLVPVLGPAVHEAVRAECRALRADRKRAAGG